MASEDVDVTSASELPQYSVTVDGVPKFDLKQYITAYKGRTVFRRLHLIASCSTALREDASKLAIVEAKKGSDIGNYNAAVALVKKNLSAEIAQTLIDSNWISDQERKNAAETKRMENELKQYKNNLIRESIRMGNEDLGQHYHSIGDLSASTKAYSRMRDFCTTPQQIASTAFRIIAVAIEQRNWLAVQSQVHKVKNLQMRPEEAARNNPKVAAAQGLEKLSTGEYRDAAHAFLNIDPGLADTYNEVITSNDVAVYGGLCSLASMTRTELQAEVLENNKFRNFLELEPHIRRAINQFCASKYSQCLEILESYRADYLLDIYLQPKLVEIYDRIRTKSIVQYFQPFSKVTLSSMEKMLGKPSTSGSSGEKTISRQFLQELIELIESGQLAARIDMENNTLVAKSVNDRAEAQKQALETVDRFIEEAHLKLLRMQVINAGIEIKPVLKGKGTTGAMDLAGVSDEDAIANGLSNTANKNFYGRGYSFRPPK